MVVCADTSFLFSLYGNDVHSPRAVKWIAHCTVPIRIGVLTRYELGNALRFSEFRRQLKPGKAAEYFAIFEAAVAAERVIVQACNLADVVHEADRLSATHTLGNGHRGFDILHVAVALKLGATQFLTFDASQKKLAQREGLKVPL